MTWRRRIKRLMWIVVIFYILGGIGLYCLQRTLVFPASWTQGTNGSKVEVTAGEELIELKTSRGDKVVALYSPARGRDGKVRSDAADCPTVLYFYGNGENVAHSIGPMEAICLHGKNAGS
jgi:hypothetical protein